MIGKTISHYKIVEKIGEGGMGVVYKALDLNLDRYVALKFLPVHMGKDENQKRRFINEAKAVSALDHPNICTIHEIEETKIDAGEDSSERIFITMAYYDGETLEEKLSGGTPISTNETINIVLQIAQGLNKSHEMDIVHRDIKPANIIVPKDAEVKIVDFGLAKLKGQPRLTKQDSTLGTITYMSPEQAEGTEVDIRTDIWSLGIIFYELLTGKSPFAADYDQAVIYNIVNTTLVSVTELNKDIPDELGNIVSTCLEKNRENRYQTFKEFISDLLKVVKKHNYIIKTRSGELHPADLTTKEKSTIPLRPAFAAVMIIFLIVAAILFWPESNYSAYEKAYFSRHYLEAQEASRDERSLTNIKAHRYFLLSTGKAKEKSLAQPTKQEYRTLLADNPNSAHAHYYLGLVYFLSPQNRAERDSVWMLYDQAEDLGLKSIYLKLDQLNYYVAKGFQQQATEMVDILLNNYPENPDVMFEVGYLYEGASDTSNARASYEKSVTLYSDFVSAHMGLFRLALERNDITSAKVYLDRAVEINSENTLVVSEKKKLYVKEGKLDEAENYLKSVIDGFGRDDGRYYEYLCRLYQDQDLFEKCMDLKSLVADRFPENSYFASLEETLQNRKDWLHFLDTQKNDKKSVQWFYNFDEALAKASREGKPVFIEFYQSDQLWSGDFDRKIYTDPKNQKFLKSYIPLKLNGNLEIDLVYKYDVDWFPATLIVNEDGEPLLPIRYFQYFSDASEIFTDLNNGLSNYRKYVEGKSSLEQRITEVSTIDDALLLSKSKNLPVMAVVISRNSEWSQKLINETFNHPLVQPELRSVILVKMDQATSKRFVREKGITYFPSILFMDSKGKTIYQVQGYQKPKVLVRLISDINYSFANNQAYQGKVNWLYDLEEATFFAAVQKKEVFIFINADWCPYCLWMMKYVFTDPLIIEKLNTDFIPLELDHRLDPEQVNSLGVKSFPTFVILNPDQSEIFRINGRTDVPELLATLDLEKRKPLYAVLGREKYQEFYKYENLVSKFLYRRYSMSAIRASRKQIAVYPEYWQSYLNIAEAYRRLNDPARMLSYYIQALEKGADIDRPFVENVLS
jgi:serine/threonine protein kinase/thioredoxin-related protein